jgi:hypothetical protein
MVHNNRVLDPASKTLELEEALGHQDEKTTQIYLDNFDNTILDEVSKVIL